MPPLPRMPAPGHQPARGGIASAAEALTLLLADVARHAEFPAAEIELARGNALQALKAAEAEPDYQAGQAFDGVVYGDHPYARSRPTEGSIKGTDRAALVAAHAARFRPDRALLVIAGPITAERGFAVADKAFGDWKASGKAIADTPPASGSTAAARLRRTCRQRAVGRAHRPPGFAIAPTIPATIANAVLGGILQPPVARAARGKDTPTAPTAVSAYRVGGVRGLRRRAQQVTGAAVGEFRKQMQAGRHAGQPGADPRSVDRGQLPVPQPAARSPPRWRSGCSAARPNTWRFVIFQPSHRGQRRWEVLHPDQLSIVVVGDKAVAAQLEPFGKFAAKAD